MPQEVCPFCSLDGHERVFYSDDAIVALWDGFAVSPGHALIVPRRHVATWFDATAEEHGALLRGLEIARAAALERYRPDGFNIGINVGAAAGQTIFHLHVHLIPRYAGDVPDPRGGVRYVIPSKANYLAPPAHVHANRLPPHFRKRPLVRGEDDHLADYLRDRLDRSSRVDVAVAFVKSAGVARIVDPLRALLERGGSVRFLTGDYLGGTEPDALEWLLELPGALALRVFEAEGTSFHPKAYIFHETGGPGVAYVGSSNLTEIALTRGVEWNYELVPTRDGDGFRDVVDAFEALFAHPRTREVTPEWIAGYRRRRPRAIQVFGHDYEPVEPAEPPPNPHPVQAEALRALEETRKAGNEAGLVVLATGLGKTWLSAFDSSRPEFGRVLFVAHREEILSQARETFRRVRPEARLGGYTGATREADADVLFASIQTIGRREHLARFAPEAFDYIVVDEFHHAAAASYRRLIDRFRPKFLLGLTATPERTDGGDLLALCGENLVYRCDLFEGISRGLLSPFHYFGVPDEVDYDQIPWRGTRFDEEALTTAVATKARAENALEQWRKRAGKRTLAFCVSRRHADFMAEYFEKAGVRAAAVHSGPSSAGRAESLAALRSGELRVLFAVDMFNEGLDVPEIDTVLMLRPTESRIIWLQQFGRGLRKADEKPFVTVVDYIGNHRVFLTKPRALLGLAAGQVAVRDALRLLQTGRFELPPGCEVTYELEAIEILRKLTGGAHAPAEVLLAYYEEFVEEHGVRPRAVEAFHDGFNPRAAARAYGSWFGFVRAMGGLDPAETAALESAADFLAYLEKTPMTRSYKMLVLEAMLARDAFPGEIRIDDLVDGFAVAARRSAALRRDVSVLDDREALKRMILDWPVARWIQGRGTGGVQYFEREGDLFRTSQRLAVTNREAFARLVRELVEWRLAAYVTTRDTAARAGGGVVCKVNHSGGRPIIFPLNRKLHPDLPSGWTEIEVEGEIYLANFVMKAVNVVRRPNSKTNELAKILRSFFGESAGRPGTRHYVVFERHRGVLRLRPAQPPEGGDA